MITVDKLRSSPLGNIPNHRGIEGVQRLAPSDAFPLQLSAHRVENPRAETYCDVHSHEDLVEFNLFLPSKAGMAFEVSDGRTSHQITSPTALWIPTSVPHQANALSGSGWFVCLRLPARSFQS